MPPVMKLTLRWEEGENKSLHTVLKMKVPRQWKEGSISNILTTFVEHYNKKHPDNALDAEQVHFLNTKGIQLSNSDIVIQVLQPGDHVRVKPGPAPKRSSIPQSNAKREGHINSKKELEEVVTKSKHDFDFSKWDKLDLSDDDGVDVHPNIDKASWVKLMGQQRKERREKEDAKIAKFNQKIKKYSDKAKEIQAKIDAGDDDAQLVVDLNDAVESEKSYQQKLDHFLAHRKMIADDVCETRESRGLVAKPKAEEPAKVAPMSPDEEASTYEEFTNANRPLMKEFASIRNEEASEEFLLKYPQLLTERAEGFLLLLTLDTCLKHQLTDKTEEKTAEQKKAERAKELGIGRQHLTIHYITELAKSMRRDPRSAVKPFFRKTGRKAEDKVEGFEEDLTKFLERIRNRATEKIAKGETRPLVDKDPTPQVEEEEEEYEPILGPGGLDPNEVLPTLPEVIQEAFVEQNTEKLRQGFEELSEEDAAYHLKRCIDSGLWVPAEKPEAAQEGGEEGGSAKVDEVAETNEDGIQAS